jgi:hypothetical protein
MIFCVELRLPMLDARLYWPVAASGGHYWDEHVWHDEQAAY